MFGMENQKKKQPKEEFLFDLEKELKDVKRQKELIAMISQRVDTIKKALRDGSNKDMFNKYGLLLNGYAALVKVLERSAKRQVKK